MRPARRSSRPAAFAVAFALALAATSAASADEPTRPRAPEGAGASAAEAEEGAPRAAVTRNAVLVYPFAFARRGFAFAYERAFPAYGLAVLGRLAYDRQAGGDYRSNGFGLGAEGRWYFLRRGPFTRYVGPAPLGPYVGLRFGWMDTRLRGSDQRYVGSAHRITWETAFGFRMVIASWVDLTPFVAASVNQDFLGGVASDPRMTFAFGLAVGVLFDREARR